MPGWNSGPVRGYPEVVRRILPNPYLRTIHDNLISLNVINRCK